MQLGADVIKDSALAVAMVHAVAKWNQHGLVVLIKEARSRYHCVKFAEHVLPLTNNVAEKFEMFLQKSVHHIPL